MQPSSRPEDFVPHRPFPAESHLADRPPPRVNWLSRYVMPVALFVAIVGIIAWVVQNMPKWQPPPKTTGEVDVIKGDGQPILEFPRGEKAQWDKEVADASKELERGFPGYYDFPFRNPDKDDVELGLLQPSCDCVSIKVALLDREEWDKVDGALARDPGEPVPYTTEPKWQELATSRDKGILVPGGERGVVRVGWNGRKDPGRALNLTPKFWTQPKGQPAQRFDRLTLTVPITMAPPIHYHPPRVGVGTLGPGQKTDAKFYLWSVTRDELNLKVQQATPDPLVDVELRRLPPEEWPGFIKTLEDEGQSKAKLKCAFVATATVHEKKDGVEMDLGPFLRSFRILVDELPQDTMMFQVYGVIRSSVEVSGSDEPGKIKLKSFSVKMGTRQAVSLWTEPNMVLERHEHSPAGLEVKLSKNEKESTSARTKWRLDVIIPPDAVAPGTFAEDSAVVLRIANSNPPRLVRIPIVAHADAD